MHALIVTNPFGGRDRGARITDPAEVAAILGGEHARDVVRADHADAHHATEMAEEAEPEETTTQEA